MRALVAKQYGPPHLLALEDLPIPDPGPGRLQVRVRAAALNPADLLMMDGTVRDLVPLDFPYIPGTDFSGTVTALGKDVETFEVGEEVFGFGAPPSFAAGVGIPAITSGAMAEYAVFAAGDFLARRPDGLSAETAAALPSTGMTGLAVIEEGQFQPGEKVLVIGAGGGIGSVVVPLLADRVDVIATASYEDEQYVRDLGAGEVIDYLEADTVDECLRRVPGGVDVIINLALKGDPLIEAARAIKPGGRLLSTTPGTPAPSAFGRDDLAVSVVMGTLKLTKNTLPAIATHALRGTLPDPVTRRYRLSEAALAYQDFAHTHSRGKVVVTMSDEPAP
ncbi:NADP-dependent oxidoreductase [Nonomuraea sp. MG754425]|nr:NADP-dependent oxidoreductase [Nonomuraea sp. MG754425]